MSKIKLTIGVPVYNAAPYLDRCLSSLLRQNMNNDEYEILCIDDGSTDDSWQILSKYKEENPDIFTLLRNERNIGLALTRNRLLENARGLYLGFVDADDYVIDGAFSYILDNFISEEIDVLNFRMITLDDNVLSKNIAKTDVHGELLFHGRAKQYLEKTLPFFVQVLFIKTQYVRENHLEFLNTRYCEDPLFILRLFMTDPMLRVISSDVYRYTVNPSQMSRERKPEQMKTAVESYLTFLDYLCMYRDSSDNNRLILSLNKIIEGQMTPFVSRMLCAQITKEKFCQVKQKLKSLSILPLPRNGHGKFINIIFSSYYIFLMSSGLYSRFFIPYVLPRLNRN